MKYYVYHEDDYPENGGIGMHVFETEEDATEFIEDRMRHGEDRKIKDYTLIKGKVLEIESVEIVTAIRVKS